MSLTFLCRLEDHYFCRLNDIQIHNHNDSEVHGYFTWFKYSTFCNDTSNQGGWGYIKGIISHWGAGWYAGNGGGGGSYIKDTASNTSSTAGENEGHGKIVITYCAGFCFTATSIAANNSYVDVTLAAGAYDTNGGSGALELSLIHI